MKYLYAALIVALGLMAGGAEGKALDVAIHNGSKVEFDYALTVDGKVRETSEKAGPLKYTQGDGKLIPGLSRQMEGMRVGDEKMIEVKPDEAYGSPNPNALKEVPLPSLPAGMKPEVGMPLQGRDKNGQVFLVKIVEVKKDSVIMDFNHPLAGKTLLFKVKIVSIK